MIKLASVVVFYNPSKENIENINKYEKSVDRIFVVDNTNDDVIRVKETKKIKYVKLNKNMGIAHALNVGAQNAIEEGYKWLLTLDQDSKITEKNVNDLKEFLDKTKIKKIGLVSPYQDIGSTEEKNNVEYEDMIEVMTSGNIIDLEVYKKIGGFKDWMFIDCVDTEYCMNLHKNGYKVLRLNNVIMKHNLGDVKVHKLFGKEYPCYNHSPFRRYYIVRNTHYINDMYRDIFPEYCDHLLRIQKGQVKRILAFEKQKFKKLKSMYRGYRDYKKNKKGAM